MRTHKLPGIIVARLLLTAAVCLGSGVAFADEALPGGGGAVEHPAAAVEVDPNWMDNLEPGETCGTWQRYVAAMTARGTSPADALCPDLGICDDPIVRDAAIPTGNTPIKIYRLSIHVFCEDGGGNCAASQATVDAAMTTLNADYEPWRIQFNYETSFHDSTQYRFLDGNEEAGMKAAYVDSPNSKLNVYVVSTGGVSWGTFPWDPDALTFMGGIVIHETWFDGVLPSVFTHEVGHCVGLWHTHHGVSEVPECSDCYEEAGRSSAQGDVTGDRCADTEPTPSNQFCADPGGTDPCSNIAWDATPYTNFMGNATQGCKDEFTPEQAGRSHCWTEDVLSGWLCGSSVGCGNGVCEPSLGEDCLSCQSDCNGKQNGRARNRFCCGDGDGQNPVGCGDDRCTSNGFDCSDLPILSTCCGDGMCDAGEDPCNCELDCGPPPSNETNCTDGFDEDCDGSTDCGDPDCDADPACACTPTENPELSCADGIDNDCDGFTDCDDGDCDGDPACGSCGARNDPCTVGDDCCSGVCKNNGRCR